MRPRNGLQDGEASALIPTSWGSVGQQYVRKLAFYRLHRQVLPFSISSEYDATRPRLRHPASTLRSQSLSCAPLRSSRGSTENR